MLPFPFSSQPSLAALTVPRRAHPCPPFPPCPRQQPSLAAFFVPVSSRIWPPKTSLPQFVIPKSAPGWFYSA